MPLEALERAARAQPDKALDFDAWVGWTPKQEEALAVTSKHWHNLYGGAAGGGKVSGSGGA